MKLSKKIIMIVLCVLLVLSSIVVANAQDDKGKNYKSQKEEITVSLLTENILPEGMESKSSKDSEAEILVDQNATQNTFAVVEKEAFDRMTPRLKKALKDDCVNELNNKKAVSFLGDSDNLELNQIFATLDLGTPVEIEYDNEETALVGLKAITVYYDDNMQLHVTFYSDIIVDQDNNVYADAKSEDDMPNIIAKMNERINDENIDSENNAGDLQLKGLVNGSGAPAVISWNQNIKWTDGTIAGEGYYTLKGSRVGTGDNFTVWEIAQSMIMTPKNNDQNSSLFMEIIDYSDSDEYLERYSPDSTINSNGISTSSGFSFSKGGASFSKSVSTSNSYSDLTVKPYFSRLEGKANWFFDFTYNTNVSKNSRTLETKTLMTNRASTMMYKHRFNVSFASRYGSKWSTMYAFDSVSVSYADIRTK